MKILITGATGTVGSDLSRELIENTDIPLVICTHKSDFLLQKQLQRANIELVKLDLRDKSAIDEVMQKYKPTHLLHLAWEGSARKASAAYNSEKSFEELNWEWLNISIKLLNSFIDAGGEYFIATGTAVEYGNQMDNCKEDMPVDSQYPYPKCKQAFLEVLKAAKITHGLKFLWLRLFYVVSMTSKAKTTIILQALQALKNKQDFETWINPETEFDFVLIDDIASIARELIQNKTEGVINIGTGHPTNVSNLIHTIFEKENLSELLHHNQPYRPKERVVADISKLKQEIGDFTFTDVSQVLTNKN